MATYFLDTSALAKLYIIEPGTERMLALATREDEPRLVILSLARVELHAAIQRRFRSGDLSVENARTAVDLFNEQIASIYLLQPVNEAILERAIRLLELHGLRAYDAIQLAAGLLFPNADGPATFVSADKQQLEAARAEGIDVWNPEANTLN